VDKLDAEVKMREEKEAWADELVRQLEKEKKLRIKLEEERRALAAFVSKFDSLGLGGLAPSKLKLPMPIVGGATTAFAERQQNKVLEDDSPVKIELGRVKGHPSLLEQMPEEEWSMVGDMSFDEKDFRAGSRFRTRDVVGGKENTPA